MKYVPRVVLSLADEPFFSGLEPSLLARMEGLVYHREYEARQIVFFPDDPCDFVYWVRKGRVRVTRVSDDGRELSFRHLLAGDMLGEECLVGRFRRENYAEALRQSILCIMRAEDFRRCVREEAEIGHRVAQCLCLRAIESEQVLVETVFHSVRRRVAAGLLRLYQREGAQQDGAVHVTHQELANLIGSTRETTTATLHGLSTDDLIELSNRRLKVKDPVALERLARSG